MRSFLFIPLAICLAITTAGSKNALAKEHRIALVIGNSTYQNAPLVNPVNDAALMARTLRDIGFQVIERKNTTQRNMKKAIRDFGRALAQAGDQGVGLFYYAGHGVQVNGNNYLVPIDAQIAQESDVTIEAVNANAVLAAMEYARSRLNFVVLDACRNNPFARSFRSSSSGLARMDAPRGTLIAYATGPGSVALDGDSSNSPYTTALAEAMRKGQAVELMFRDVRNQVMGQTKNKQIPWESSSLTGGNFYFNPDAVSQGKTVQSVKQEPQKSQKTSREKTTDPAEIAFWNSVADSGDTHQIQAYLDKYPNGKFSSLAYIKMNSAAKKRTTTKTASLTSTTQDSYKQTGSSSQYQQNYNQPQQDQYAARPPQGGSGQQGVYSGQQQGGYGNQGGMDDRPQRPGTTGAKYKAIVAKAVQFRPEPLTHIPPGPYLAPGTVLTVTGEFNTGGIRWAQIIGPRGDTAFIPATAVRKLDTMSHSQVRALQEQGQRWTEPYGSQGGGQGGHQVGGGYGNDNRRPPPGGRRPPPRRW